MRRRHFITLVGGAAIAWPRTAWSQEPGRTYRVGGVSTSPRNGPYVVAMFDELRRQGFIEGQNLTIDWRGYATHVDLIPELIAQVVKAQVDVIYAGGDTAIRAAQEATTTIPILGITNDMVGSGLVNSLARPGGNTTGMSLLATELDGKRQEILIEAVPGLRRMAALADSKITTPSHLQELQGGAHARGIELSIHQVAKPEEISAAIDAAKATGAAALNVMSSPVLYGNRQIIIQHVAALQLPAIYEWPVMTAEGGLIGYGPRIVKVWREIVASQLVKLLRGSKPTDLPIQQPTKFDLAINLKTAKALGLTIPPVLLARSDEVVE